MIDGRAVGAAACRDERARGTLVHRGGRRRPPQVSAETGFFRHVLAKRVLDDGIEDPVLAVDPHLVVVARDRRHVARALERAPRARGLVEDVAHAEDHASRGRTAAQRAERIEQLAGDAAGPLVDDHQVRLEAQDRFDQDRPPDPIHFGRLCGQESRPVALGGRPIQAGELDVVQVFRNAERLDHRRAGHDQHRRTRILLRERLREQQRAPDIAEAERVVRIEEDLRRRRPCEDRQRRDSRCLQCNRHWMIREYSVQERVEPPGGRGPSASYACAAGRSDGPLPAGCPTPASACRGPTPPCRRDFRIAFQPLHRCDARVNAAEQDSWEV